MRTLKNIVYDMNSYCTSIDIKAFLLGLLWYAQIKKYSEWYEKILQASLKTRIGILGLLLGMCYCVQVEKYSLRHEKKI